MRQEILSWEDVDNLMDALLPQLIGRPFDAILLITRGGIVPGGLISEALDIKYVLTASISFPLTMGHAKLLAWPEFLQFPDEDLIAGRRTLVVDDVWGSGRTITAVKNRVEAAGGFRAVRAALQPHAHALHQGLAHLLRRRHRRPHHLPLGDRPAQRAGRRHVEPARDQLTLGLNPQGAWPRMVSTARRLVLFWLRASLSGCAWWHKRRPRRGWRRRACPGYC
jgi:hypothetical protein